MIFRTSTGQAAIPRIVSNCGGYGNTSYSLGAPAGGDAYFTAPVHEGVIAGRGRNCNVIHHQN